jgi:hypothetical protein
LGIQKNFVVKNGLEVDTNTFYVDSDENKVGVGTIFPDVELRVIGSIGCTDFEATRNLTVSGISTFNELQFTGDPLTIGSTSGQPGQYLRSTGDGVEWATFPTTVRSSQAFTAIDNQTTFTYAYNIGYVDVYVNGVKLKGDGVTDTTDYIANNGVNIVLNEECFEGDFVELLAYNPAAVGSGNTGILGITVQEEGVIIGNDNGINSINFIGVAVTAVGSGAGVTVYASGASGGSTVIRDDNVIQGSVTSINFTGNAVQATASGTASTITVNSGINTTGTSDFNNVNVSGSLTATTLYGDGSGLTNIVSTGTGVEVQEDGSVVGTAATISFADGFSVDPIQAGVVTVRVNTQTYWDSTDVGIHTLSSVGIGTTNPTAKLTVDGGGSFTGVVTANTYYGDGSNLTGVQGTIFSTNATGINTTSFIGIGTTTSTSALTVSGDVSVTGITTSDKLVSTGLSAINLNVTGVSTFTGLSTFLNATVYTLLDVDGHTNLDNVSVSGVTTFAGDTNVDGLAGIGSMIVTGVSTFTGNIDANGDLDVDGHTNLDNVNVSGAITATTFTGNLLGNVTGTADNAQNLTGTPNIVVGIITASAINAGDVYGITSGMGTFTASAGVAHTVDTFTISSTDYRTAEYTIHVGYGTFIQGQKVLVIQNGEYAYAQEYAIMYQPDVVVSVGATITAGELRLEVTPETGVTGLTTYRFTRQTML